MELFEQHCIPYAKGSPALSAEECAALLTQAPDWEINAENSAISRLFHFKNYYQTIAFVNAVAWICHQQDHHPDMTVSYNRCHITFSTHTVAGLSRNDFICATRIDRILGNRALTNT